MDLLCRKSHWGSFWTRLVETLLRATGAGDGPLPTTSEEFAAFVAATFSDDEKRTFFVQSVCLPRCLKVLPPLGDSDGDGDASTAPSTDTPDTITTATAAVSSERSQRSERSVTDLRMSWQPAGDAGQPSTSSRLALPPANVVQWFIKSIEARLSAVVCGAYEGGTTPIPPDTGLEKIFIDGKEKLYIKESLDKSFQLLYTGNITRTPTRNSLKLCEAWGESFYIDGQGLARAVGVNAERFVPAWAIPLASGDGDGETDQPNKKKSKPKKQNRHVVELNYAKITLPFTFRYRIGLQKHEITVVLLIHSLVAPDMQPFTSNEEGGYYLARSKMGDPFPDKDAFLNIPTAGTNSDQPASSPSVAEAAKPANAKAAATAKTEAAAAKAAKAGCHRHMTI